MDSCRFAAAGKDPTPRSASTSLAVSGPRPVAGVAAGAPDVRRPSSLAWKDVGGHPGAALLMRFGLTAHPGFESRSLRPALSPAPPGGRTASRLAARLVMFRALPSV